MGELTPIGKLLQDTQKRTAKYVTGHVKDLNYEQVAIDYVRRKIFERDYVTVKDCALDNCGK